MKHFAPLVAGVLLATALVACQPIQPIAIDPAVVSPESAADAGPAPAAVETAAEVTLEEESAADPLESVPDVVPLAGTLRLVHDPVIAEEDGTYYVFYSGGRIPVLKSNDMVNWEFAYTVFDYLPSWVLGINPQVGNIWAPDISYFNDKWHVYYSVSSAGSQNSGIGVATNSTLNPDSPDYEWQDQGMVFRTHPGAVYNAIDPSLALDASRNPWLVWGSYWTGIYMRRIDPATGHFDDTLPEVVHIAQRSVAPDFDPSLEGAFIIRHGDYYYLFASFDQCCMGAASTYNVRVGRSREITGPYIDREGVPMLEAGGTMLLEAYDRWRGPGHNGILQQDGSDWIVYHAYDSRLSGIYMLRIERMHWDDEGWPWLTSQVEQP